MQPDEIQPQINNSAQQPVEPVNSPNTNTEGQIESPGVSLTQDPVQQPNSQLGKGGTFVADTKQLEAKKEEEKVPISKIIRLYVIPLVTLGIFSGIVVLLIVPAVNGLFAGLEEISVLGEEANDLDEDLLDLQALQSNFNQVESDLQDINSIVPTGDTEIASFQERIVKLAIDQGLIVREVQTAEQILQTGEQDISVLGIIEIPTLFSIEGELDLAVDFITGIQQIDDFIIIGEMDLSSSDNIKWNLELLLIKYQFQDPNEDNRLLEAYSRVPPSAQANSEVLDLIRR